WFRSRQDGTARTRRKTIVGVARKLLIALWRYVTQDIAPEGARFRAASA
ncbi:MAG: IS110 family transposase, partial [Myxococcales bacterium]|nr:IS110 family transposase [Myxococcales bacterium]